MEFRTGYLNTVVDALSRQDSTASELHALSAANFDIFPELLHAVTTNPELVTIPTKITGGSLGAPWGLLDSLITFAGRVFVSPSSPFLSAILEAAHSLAHECVQRRFIVSATTFTFRVPVPLSKILYVHVWSDRGTR